MNLDALHRNCFDEFSKNIDERADKGLRGSRRRAAPVETLQAPAQARWLQYVTWTFGAWVQRTGRCLEENTVNLKTILTLAALASIGANASAANVTDWGTLGPVTSVAYVTYHDATGPIDDVYLFDIGAASDVNAYGEEFEARSVTMTDAAFTLFAGVYGSGDVTQIDTPFSFNNTATETMYANLASGNYYFEITGTSAMAGSGYDFEASANNAAPPLAVPEPANAALLLAGIGLMAFMSSRRRQQ